MNGYKKDSPVCNYCNKIDNWTFFISFPSVNDLGLLVQPVDRFKWISYKKL